MNERRSATGRAIAVGLGASLLALACGSSESGSRHNVILIVVDTLRADMLAEGAPVTTPGIDRLRADGVVFESAFSHAPMTLPSHTALFASRPPTFTGVTNNWQNVPEELPLLADWLAQHGYTTHGVVSLGTLNPHEGGPGLDRGFERYDLDYWHMDKAPDALERMQARLDALEGSDPFFFFAHFSDPHAPYNAHGEDPVTAEVRLDGELVDTISTSDMTQWERTLTLDEGKHVLEVSSPRAFQIKSHEWLHRGARAKPTWEVGEANQRTKEIRLRADLAEAGENRIRFWIAESLDRSRIPERYHGEVEFLDEYVGRFLEELDRRGLYEDSLIVFTSDHGEALGEHGLMGAHVQNLFDEMLHVPLIVKLPAGHPAQERIAPHRDAVVGHQDVVPTILSLLGLPELPDQQGRSLLFGPSPEVLAETHRDEAARDYIGYRNGRFKLIYDIEAESFQLYDLGSDPGELQDVFATRSVEVPAGWCEQLETLGAASTGDGAPLSPELIQKLQALGYMDSEEPVDEPPAEDEQANGEEPEVQE